jgi:hypothetical protein
MNRCFGYQPYQGYHGRLGYRRQCAFSLTKRNTDWSQKTRIGGISTIQATPANLTNPATNKPNPEIKDLINDLNELRQFNRIYIPMLMGVDASVLYMVHNGDIASIISTPTFGITSTYVLLLGITMISASFTITFRKFYKRLNTYLEQQK